MNSDDFEKRLERQTIRPIPGEWRREILLTATERRAQSDAPYLQLKTQNSKLKTFLSELLWPCPQAWAGLAAVWILIFAMSISSGEPKRRMAKTPPPSSEYLMALKEQRQLYLELAGLNVKEIAEPPKLGIPGPRSERKNEYQCA